METAKDLASCPPPEGKTWSLFLKVTNEQMNSIDGAINVQLKVYVIWISLKSCPKVDCGNKRAGVQSEDVEAVNIVAFIHKHPR